MKRWISLVMTLVFLLSTLGSLNLSAWADWQSDNYPDVPALTPDTPVTVTYDGSAASGALLFTPEEDGKYTFFSEGSQDTVADLYDSEETWLAGDDDSGEGSNFRIEANLTGGVTYVLLTRLYSGSGQSYTVTAHRVPALASLSLSLKDPAAALVQGRDEGYWTDYYDYDLGEYVPYYYFYDSTISDLITVTGSYDDGTEAVIDRNYTYYSIDADQETWTPGGDHNMVTVTLEEKSAQIHIPVITLAEFCADAPLLAEGTETEVDYQGADFDGVFRFVPDHSGRYMITSESDYSTRIRLFTAAGDCLYETSDRLVANGLNAGDTYYLLTDVYGNYQTVYTLTADYLPELTGISLALADPETVLVQGKDSGYWTSRWNGEGYDEYYYFYDYKDLIQVTGTYADGTEGPVDEQVYYIEFYAEQWTWTPGGDHNTVTVTVGEISEQIHIPVISFGAYYAGAILLPDGGEKTVTCDGTDTSGVLRFVPEKSGRYEFVTEIQNGYLRLCSARGEYITDGSYRITAELTAGNEYYLIPVIYAGEETYTVTARWLPAMTGLTVTLKPGAVLVQGKDDGYWNSYYDYDSEQYVPYYYFYTSAVKNVLTILADYEDGTQAPVDEDIYYVQISFNPSAWTAGGDSNAVAVTVGDFTATVNVPVSTFGDYYASAPVLGDGESAEVTCESDEVSGVFRILPQVDGTYRFTADGDGSYYLYLYDQDGKTLKSARDSLSVELESGKTYFLMTSNRYAQEDTYTVYARWIPKTVGISAALRSPDAALVQGKDEGYWNTYSDGEQEIKYYRFSNSAILNILTVSILYENGTVEEADPDQIYITLAAEQWTWTPGGDHNMLTVTVNGFSDDIHIPVISYGEYCSDLPLLAEGELTSVAYEPEDKSGAFRFVPAVSGKYDISSSGNLDTFVTLKDDVGRTVASNDDGGAGSNFRLVMELEAGKTYILETRTYYSVSGRYTVVAKWIPKAVSLSLSLRTPDAALVAGKSSGYWSVYDSGEGEFEYYSFYEDAVTEILKAEAEFEDGSRRELSYGYDTFDLTYEPWTWTAGGDHNLVTVTIDEVTESIALPVVSFADFYNDAPVLPEGERTEGIVGLDSNLAMWQFTPTLSDRYQFVLEFSRGRFTLYDELGHILDSSDARITTDLTAGARYFLQVRSNSTGKNYPYALTGRHLPMVTGLSLSLRDPEAPLVEGLSYGWWDGDYGVDPPRYYYVFEMEPILDAIEITAVFANGDQEILTFDDSFMSLSYDCSVWAAGTAGNTVRVEADSASASIDLPVITFGTYFASAPLLAEDDETVVSYDGTDLSGAFRFIPSQDGRYRFTADGGSSGYLRLFDEKGEFLSDANGKLNVYLDAGETYYLLTSTGNGNSGDFTVTGSWMPAVTALTLSLREPGFLVTGREAGYWWTYTDSEGSFERYVFYDQSPLGLIELHAVFENGTEGVLSYDDDVMSYSCNTSTWTPGGTENTLTVTVDGVSASINIPVITFDEFMAGVPTLTEEAPAEVFYDGTERSGVLLFVPAHDGKYRFTSDGSFDTDVAIYDGMGHYIDYNDDGGERNNFALTVTLEGGKHYYLLTRILGNNYTGPYTVSVGEKKIITSLTVSLTDPNAALVAGIDSGYWTSGYLTEYYAFRQSAILDLLTFRAVFADGSEGEADFYEYGMEMTADQQLWTPGGHANTVTFTVDGVTASVNVPVISFESYVGSAALLEEDVSTDAAYDGTVASGAFRFVPEADGRYEFTGYGDDRVYLQLYSEQGRFLASSYNRITRNLEAGVPCVLLTGPGNDSDTSAYTVRVRRLPAVTRLTLELKDPAAPLVIGLHSGYWSGGNYWFHDSAILSRLAAHAYYEDGTDAFITSLDYNYMDLDADQSEWTVGGAHNTVTLTVDGVSESIDVPVTDMAAYFDGVPLLAEGTDTEVDYDGTDRSGVFRFVPEKDGRYVFGVSSDEAWVYLGLYAEDGTLLQGSEYGVSQILKAGKTYFLVTRESGYEPATYSVRTDWVRKITAISLSLKDPAAVLTTGMDGGYWDSIGSGEPTYVFYYGTVANLLQLEVTYEDGASEVRPFESSYMELSFDPFKWTAGGSENTATVTVDGVSDSINIPVQTFAEGMTDVPALTLDTPLPVTVNGEPRYASFTAPADGLYYFYSAGSLDTFGDLQDASGYYVGYSDDMGTNRNFMIRSELKAGDKVFLVSGTYNGEPGSFTVNVSRSAPDFAAGFDALEGTNLSAKTADLVLVADTTDSLDWIRQLLRQALPDFAASLTGTGLTLRIALVDYMADPSSVTVHQNGTAGIWFDGSDLTALMAEIDALRPGEMYAEQRATAQALAALLDSSKIPFDANALKYAWLITDGRLTMSDGEIAGLAGDLKDAEIILSVMADKMMQEQFAPLAYGTGGVMIGFEGGLNDTMGALANAVAAAAAAYVPGTPVDPCAGGHHLTRVPARDATPERDGNIEYWVCSACGKYFSDSEGKHEITAAGVVVKYVDPCAAGHTLTHVPAVAATPEKDGNKEYWVCSVCGKYFADAAGQYEIAPESVAVKYQTTENPDDPEDPCAAGHTLTHVPATAATPEKDGNKEYWVCDECGKFFADANGQYEVSADTLTVKYEAPAAILGDADGDGNITSTDARLALQISVGKLDKSSVKDPDALDVDGDGNITSTDARLILQFSVNKITSFPRN